MDEQPDRKARQYYERSRSEVLDSTPKNFPIWAAGAAIITVAYALLRQFL